MDYSQNLLIKKIQQYLDIKNPHGYELTFNLKDGICSGLVAYWLYSVANDEEGRFVDKLEYALNWDVENFKKSTAKVDLKLEELINVIFLLHYPLAINNQIDQFNLDTVFPLLLNSNQPSILEPEFKITFIFNQPALNELLDLCVFPNKMIRLGNGLHAIGLIYHDKKYCLYDPDCEHLIQYFDDVKSLAAVIFNIFATKASVKDYIAMNATIFDLEESIKPIYPDPLEFCTELLERPNYKSNALNDKYLFNLCAKYNEYALLDLLFANGYKYIPWENNLTTELNNAVYSHDLKKIQYLLAHDVPVDYKSKFGVAPLNVAIKEAYLPMVYILLNAGANPNADSTYLSIALKNKFSQGVILLLAFGLNVSQKDVENIQEVFTSNYAQAIFESALALNEKILKLPEKIDLENPNSKDIIKFLHNIKLKNQLGFSVDVELLKNIKDVYDSDHKNLIFNITEKEDVYEILKYFYPEMTEYSNEEQENLALEQLSLVLQQITDKITSKNANQHSKSDLLEIQIILEKIVELQASTDKELSNEASKAEDKIRQYLKGNKVQYIPHKANNLFFILNKPEDKLQTSYEDDIVPFLSAFKDIPR